MNIGDYKYYQQIILNNDYVLFPLGLKVIIDQDLFAMIF